MKEICIIYQFSDESHEQYEIPLDNYIEQNDIQDLEKGIIITILNNEQIEFDANSIQIYNKELEEWEDLEHFYVQIEDLMEEDSCYNYDNGIRLSLKRQQIYFEAGDTNYEQYQQAQQQYDQQQLIQQGQLQPQQQLESQEQNLINQQQQQYLEYLTSYINIFANHFEQQNLYNQQIESNFSILSQDFNLMRDEVSQNTQLLLNQISSMQDQIKNFSKSQTGGGGGSTTSKNLFPTINFGNIDQPTGTKEVNLFADIINLNQEGQSDEDKDKVDYFGTFDQENKNENGQSSIFTPMTKQNSDSNTKPIIFSTLVDQPKQDSIQFGQEQNNSKSPISMLGQIKKIDKSNTGAKNVSMLIPPTTPVVKPPSSGFQIKPGMSFCQNTIRMSIMYSEPLVVKKKGLVYAAGEPVEYEQEILNLTKYFQKVKNNVEINIRVANMDNLEEEIIGSQIIHLSCHGDFHEEQQKYYLQFEERNCELKCVTTEQFRTLLQNKKQRPKLTFVNACHSEEVGNIFLNSGIPFVVAVQSNLKIQDKAAQIFSNSFYMGLMEGYSIRQAFKSAKDSLVAKHHSACYTCCCAHKHSNTCQWQTYALDYGYQAAHSLHEKYTCDCYNPSRQNSEIKNPIYHKKMCAKIIEFFQCIEHESKVDDMVMLEGNAFYGCCCQDESTPHDESAKFKLLCKNDTLDFTFQFEKGEMVIKQNFDMYNSQFRSQFKLFGRNVEMYDIFNSLNDSNNNNQFVVVYGERGSGLTSISKKVARHLKEREFVNEIIIEDFENVDRGISKFKTKLKKFKNGNKEQGYNTLMILDNCDDLIQKNLDDFSKQLSDTSLRVKFIIITHFKPNLKFNEAVINYVELKSLDQTAVDEIIYHHVGNEYRKLQQNPTFNKDISELLSKKPILPKFVMEIVQSIKNGSNLSDLLKVQDPLDIILKKLKEFRQKYEMLLVISLFPHGVSVEDLKYLASKNKIPSNWDSIMLELTSKENVDKNLVQIINESDSGGSSDNLELQNSTTTIQENHASHNHQENHHFKIGQYFWMSVSKNELQMIQFKIKKNIPRWLYSKEEYSIDLLQKEVLILEYLSFFAKKMLNSIKEDRYSKLKMIDYSSIVDFGLFKISFSKDWFQDNDNSLSPTSLSPTPTLSRSYSDNFEDHIFKKYKKNHEHLFKLHEQNLYVYLKKEDQMNLIKFMNSSQCSEKKVLKEVLKDLCVDIPSIHKLLDHKEDALEQCEKAIGILEELSKFPDHTPFLLAKMKIILIQINICFDQFDFSSKNPEEFSQLCKHFQSLNEGIESLENDVDFKHQKNIIKVIKAEKIFLISYTAKILIEQKLIKYLDESYDLSILNELISLIDYKGRAKNYSSMKDICTYMINQLDINIAYLSEMNEDSIIINSSDKSKPNSKVDLYLQERTSSSLEILISKIKYITVSINGFQQWEEDNEDYVEILQDSIQIFQKYQLNELKEQCLKQFAKLFLKNINLKKQKYGEPLSNQSQIQTEMIRLIKNGQNDVTSNISIKDTFEQTYNEYQKQQSKDYKITINTNQ